MKLRVHSCACRIALLVVAALMAASAPLSAQTTYHWTGSVNSNWNNPDNWDPTAPNGGPNNGSVTGHIAVFGELGAGNSIVDIGNNLVEVDLRELRFEGDVGYLLMDSDNSFLPGADILTYNSTAVSEISFALALPNFTAPEEPNPVINVNSGRLNLTNLTNELSSSLVTNIGAGGTLGIRSDGIVSSLDTSVVNLNGGTLAVLGGGAMGTPGGLARDSFNSIGDAAGNPANGIYTHHTSSVNAKIRAAEGLQPTIAGFTGSWDTTWDFNTSQSSSFTSNARVVAGSLSYTATGYNPEAGDGKVSYFKDVNSNFNMARAMSVGDSDTTSEYWFSGMLQLDSVSGSNFGEFVLNFSDNIQTMDNAVRLGAGTDGQLVLHTRAGGATDSATMAGVFTADTTNLLVTKIDVDRSGNEVVTLWLNPTDVTSEAMLNATATQMLTLNTQDFIGAGDTLNQFRFQAFNSAANVANGHLIDELLFGDSLVNLFGGSVAGGFGNFVGQEINVTADSTIEVEGALGSAAFGAVNLEPSVELIVANGDATFLSTTAEGAVTITTNGNVTTGQILAAGAGITSLTKDGFGSLLLNDVSGPSGLTGTATVHVAAGDVVAVTDGINSPLGAAAIALDGGDLKLSSYGGNVQFNNSLTVNTDATIAGSAADGGVAGPLTVTLGSALSGATIAETATLSLNTFDDYTLIAAGDISGLGALAVAGSVELAGDNTYAGATTVTDATLLISGSVIGTSGVDLVNSTLTSAGPISTAGNIQVDATSVFHAGDAVTAAQLNVAGALHVEAANALAGVGAANVASGALLNVAAFDANLGSVSVAAGAVFRLSQDQAFGFGAVAPTAAVAGDFELAANIGDDFDGVALAGGANLMPVGGSRTYGSDLMLNGAVNFGLTGQSLNLSGAITGDGSFVIANDTLTLSGGAPNTFTGGAMLSSGGTLIANKSGALGTGDVDINTDGVLSLQAPAAVSGVVRLNDQGTLRIGADGALAGANVVTSGQYVVDVSAAQSSFPTLHFTPGSVLTGNLTNADFGSGTNVTFDNGAVLAPAPGETNLPTTDELGANRLYLGIVDPAAASPFIVGDDNNPGTIDDAFALGAAFGTFTTPTGTASNVTFSGTLEQIAGGTGDVEVLLGRRNVTLTGDLNLNSPIFASAEVTIPVGGPTLNELTFDVVGPGGAQSIAVVDNPATAGQITIASAAGRLDTVTFDVVGPGGTESVMLVDTPPTPGQVTLPIGAMAFPSSVSFNVTGPAGTELIGVTMGTSLDDAAALINTKTVMTGVTASVVGNDIQLSTVATGPTATVSVEDALNLVGGNQTNTGDPQLGTPLAQVANAINSGSSGVVATVVGNDLILATAGVGDSQTVQVNNITGGTLPGGSQSGTGVNQNPATLAQVAALISGGSAGVTATVVGDNLVLSTDQLGASATLTVNNIAGGALPGGEQSATGLNGSKYNFTGPGTLTLQSGGWGGNVVHVARTGSAGAQNDVVLALSGAAAIDVGQTVTLRDGRATISAGDSMQGTLNVESGGTLMVTTNLANTTGGIELFDGGALYINNDDRLGNLTLNTGGDVQPGEIKVSGNALTILDDDINFDSGSASLGRVMANTNVVQWDADADDFDGDGIRLGDGKFLLGNGSGSTDLNGGSNVHADVVGTTIGFAAFSNFTLDSNEAILAAGSSIVVGSVDELTTVMGNGDASRFTAIPTGLVRFGSTVNADRVDVYSGRLARDSSGGLVGDGLTTGWTVHDGATLIATVADSFANELVTVNEGGVLRSSLNASNGFRDANIVLNDGGAVEINVNNNINTQGIVQLNGNGLLRFTNANTSTNRQSTIAQVIADASAGHVLELSSSSNKHLNVADMTIENTGVFTIRNAAESIDEVRISGFTAPDLGPGSPLTLNFEDAGNAEIEILGVLPNADELTLNFNSGTTEIRVADAITGPTGVHVNDGGVLSSVIADGVHNAVVNVHAGGTARGSLASGFNGSTIEVGFGGVALGAADNSFLGATVNIRNGGQLRNGNNNDLAGATYTIDVGGLANISESDAALTGATIALNGGTLRYDNGSDNRTIDGTVHLLADAFLDQLNQTDDASQTTDFDGLDFLAADATLRVIHTGIDAGFHWSEFNGSTFTNSGVIESNDIQHRVRLNGVTAADGIVITKSGDQNMQLTGDNSATLQGSLVTSASTIQGTSAFAFGTGTHTAQATATSRGTLQSAAVDSMNGATIVLAPNAGAGGGRLLANNANSTGGSIFRGATVLLNGGEVELQNDNRSLVVGGDFILNEDTQFDVHNENSSTGRTTAFESLTTTTDDKTVSLVRTVNGGTQTVRFNTLNMNHDLTFDMAAGSPVTFTTMNGVAGKTLTLRGEGETLSYSTSQTATLLSDVALDGINMVISSPEALGAGDIILRDTGGVRGRVVADNGNATGGGALAGMTFRLEGGELEMRNNDLSLNVGSDHVIVLGHSLIDVFNENNNNSETTTFNSLTTEAAGATVSFTTSDTQTNITYATANFHHDTTLDLLSGVNLRFGVANATGGNTLTITGSSSNLVLDQDITGTFTDNITILGNSIQADVAGATGAGALTVNGGTVFLDAADAISNMTHTVGSTDTTRGTMHVRGANYIDGKSITLGPDNGVNLGGGRLLGNNANATSGGIFAGATVTLNGGTLMLQVDDRSLDVGGNFIITDTSTFDIYNENNSNSENNRFESLLVTAADKTVNFIRSANGGTQTATFTTGTVNVDTTLNVEAGSAARFDAFNANQGSTILKTGGGQWELNGDNSATFSDTVIVNDGNLEGLAAFAFGSAGRTLTANSTATTRGTIQVSGAEAASGVILLAEADAGGGRGRIFGNGDVGGNNLLQGATVHLNGGEFFWQNGSENRNLGGDFVLLTDSTIDHLNEDDTASQTVTLGSLATTGEGMTLHVMRSQGSGTQTTTFDTGAIQHDLTVLLDEGARLDFAALDLAAGKTITLQGDGILQFSGDNRGSNLHSFTVAQGGLEGDADGALGNLTHIATSTDSTRGTISSHAVRGLNEATIILEGDNGGGQGRLFGNNGNATSGSLFDGATVRLEGGLVELQNDNRTVTVGGDFEVNGNGTFDVYNENDNNSVVTRFSSLTTLDDGHTLTFIRSQNEGLQNVTFNNTTLGHDITFDVNNAAGVRLNNFTGGDNIITKTGADTLVFSDLGTTHTGTLAINDGTLRIAGAGFEVGQLQLDGGLTQILDSGTAHTLGSSGVSTLETSATQTLTVDAGLTGAGTINKIGGGLLRITDAGNAFTGTLIAGDGFTTIAGNDFVLGGLTVGSNVTINNAGTIGNLAMNAGGSLTITAGETITVTESLGGTGSLNFAQLALADGITFKPGASAGTLTMAGDVTQGDCATIGNLR